MTIFFTVATISYLPQAVTVLDSVRKHHPDFNFFIALADYASATDISRYALLNSYPIIQLHELEASEFNFITSNYNPSQLSNSTKVLFAEHFFNHYSASKVIFCDSDMLFFDKLRIPDDDHIDFSITPHFTSPPPLHFKKQELEVLNAGLFNGGFVVLIRSKTVSNFIKWLRERSVLDCVYDHSRGIYGEQLWLNFLPLYFKNVFVDTNMGYNVAYWNLHERKISVEEGKYFVNETIPLVFFHYSGWDYKMPEQISRWGNYSSEMRPDILPLLLEYKKLLDEKNLDQYISIPNFYHSQQKRSEKKTFVNRLKKAWRSL